MKERPILLALLGGLTGALVTLGGQWAITYQSIERPKLALEEKKVDIDTYKLGIALLPIVEPACTSQRFEKSAWRVRCRLENKGQYPVDATMMDTALHTADDSVGLPIAAGDGLEIQIPDWMGTIKRTSRTFEVPLGTTGREFSYVVRYEDPKYRGMVERPDIVVKTTFAFRTIDAPVHFLIAKFPAAEGMLTQLSKSAAPVVVTATEGR